MEIYYFSFGQVHVHRIDGITLDADCLLRVIAENYGDARQRVFDAIGDKWCMQYAEGAVDFNYFPRGAVEVRSI